SAVDNPKPRVAGDEIVGYLTGLILTTVVHHHRLPILIRLRENASQALWKVLRSIVYRYNDTNAWTVHCHTRGWATAGPCRAQKINLRQTNRKSNTGIVRSRRASDGNVHTALFILRH